MLSDTAGSWPCQPATMCTGMPDESMRLTLVFRRPLRWIRRSPASRFLLDRPVTSAGRHPGSDVFLDDITVSRRHAEFRRENDELHVVDVGSLNGTYVNREPVES